MATNRIRSLFCDLHGLPRGKYVPPAVADGGRIGFAMAVFAVSLDRDLVTVPGTSVQEGLPDMELVLDGERRRSWQEGTETSLGYLQAGGTPLGLCARSALKRAVAGFEASGLSQSIGIELEAYVFQQDADGVWRPYYAPGAHVYDTGSANDPRGLVYALWETALNCELPIESVNGEYDSGQFALTLRFADALKACDDAFLFGTMAREVAAGMGLLLSFLPKPIPDHGGSGLHVNFSLLDSTGDNATCRDGGLPASLGSASPGSSTTMNRLPGSSRRQ